MSLESGTYISDLNANNPTGTDKKKEGDDHIRLLKSTIKASFPNIDGAMNATDTELNYMVGVTSLVQDQIDTLTTSVAAKLSKTVSTTQRILGRDTAGAGDAEEVALTDVLDWITTTQGTILYRGASSWAALAPGTSGQYLKTQGSGANPTWSTAGLLTPLTSDASVGTGTSYTVSSIPAGVSRVDIAFHGISFNDASELRFQLGYGGGSYTTTGYTGAVVTGGSSVSWSSHADLDVSSSDSDTLTGSITLIHCGSNKWSIQGIALRASNNNPRVISGYVTSSGELDAIQFSGSGGGSFDAGSITVQYFG